MFDNMIGDVARAMQDDRRRQAAKMARIVEAEQTHRLSAREARLRNQRAALARALMALAMRLAPLPPATTPRSEMATPATQ